MCSPLPPPRSRLHERNFPQLVKQASQLVKEDIAWLASVDPFTKAAKAESDALRAKVEGLQQHGSPLLTGAGVGMKDEVEQLAAELAAAAVSKASGVAKGDSSVAALANQLAATAMANAIAATKPEATVEELAQGLAAAAIARAMDAPESQTAARAAGASSSSSSKPNELV